MLRDKRLAVLVPLALIAWMTIRIDLVKALWFDELMVYKIAGQPRLAGLWNILTSGQSPHPPLNFLFVRCLHAVFGANEFTTRLPSTLGFLAMEAALFWFVAKRSNAAYGVVAMLFPLVTSARGFAVDAKPYGVLLGWTGIALICWRATAGRWRPWGLAGLGIALCCATSSHFFGALLGWPVLAGEFARSIQRRRIDWPVIGVTTLNWWPLAAFWPILRAGNQVHGVHPWQTPAQFGFILNSADLLLAGAAAPILLCMLIAAASRAVQPTTVQCPPGDELAAATALALLPAAAVCGLKIAGMNIVEVKYLISMTVGLAILVAWSAYLIAGRSLAAPMALAALLFVWGGRDFVRDLHAAASDRIAAQNFAPLVEAGPLPIVIETPRFMLLERYAKPEVASRIHFLLDPVAAQSYFHTDALHRSMLLNPAFFGAHVQPTAQFEAAHSQFLIYERRAGEPTWLLEKYKDKGATIELLSSREEDRWYIVRPTQPSQCARH